MMIVIIIIIIIIMIPDRMDAKETGQKCKLRANSKRKEFAS